MTSSPKAFRLGTRGSLLAMAQAEAVKKQLEPLVGEVEIVKIRTSGDAGNREKLGAFVSEIETAVSESQVDLGLHCLKDVPTRPTPGLTFAAYLPREDVRDGLLTRTGQLRDLPDRAVVGTGSLRRTSQLAAHGKSFVFKPLVGNVDTRLSKLRSGEYDAIVLAIAGLKRLGLLEEGQESSLDGICVEAADVTTIVPAVGQATLVLQMRESDPLAEKVRPLNHPPTEISSIAERSFLHRFGGGCSVPIGAYARLVEEHYVLDGLVAAPDGKVSFRGSKSFGSEQAEYFGRELAEELGGQGGFEIVEKVLENKLN